MVGLVLVVLGWPGTFLIALAATVHALATGFDPIAAATLAWLFGMAVTGEAVEAVAAGLGAADKRPSRVVTGMTLVGAFVGAVVGTPFLFGVGSLLGGLAGAFAGAACAVWYEGGGLEASVSTGLAALRGRLLGFLVKSVLAVVMIAVVIFALW